MTISVQTPTHVGPGYRVVFTGLTGPVPLDDFMQVIVSVPSTGEVLTGGSKLCHGFTSVTVDLGHSEVFSIAAPAKYLAPGGACDFAWAQNHANFTTVASGTVTGLLWDPTGAAFELTQSMLNTVGASGPLAQILAAVRITKTTPGQI